MVARLTRSLAHVTCKFCATQKASEAIGAQIVLGDRLIEITLERAWNSLRWIEKRNLVLSVVRGITSPPLDQFQNNVEESSEDNGTFQLYEQLIFSYPLLLDPLIHERDTYLAWSLKRSKAVNRSKGVVGVIRKGPHEWCNICTYIRPGQLVLQRSCRR